MVYKKDVLEKKALSVIKKHRLVFIDEISSYLSCSRATFYLKGLDKLDTIKKALEENRISIKRGLREKWYENDVPTTQIALYKLIGTEKECNRLNGNPDNTQNEDIHVNITFDD